MKVRSVLRLAAVLLLLAARPAVVSAAETAGAAARPEALPAELNGLRQQVERELREDILKFWIQHAVDRERGGFYGEISNELKVRRDAERGALLTSRILWTFSAAYRRYQDPAYLEMARWAWDDLMKRFWDPEFGGLYWSTTADGRPVRTVKQVYGQVFGIYALSEFYRATHETAALERAIEIYRQLERHAVDPKNGGYWEVLRRDWSVDPEPRHSALEPRGAKSQNTHLHVMEAYTNLLRVWPDPGLRESQRRLMEVMATRILDSRTHHLILFLDAAWKPRSEEVSFGHDIEFSWLIAEAAEVLGDADWIARARALSLDVARVTAEQGVAKDGGLIYEAGPAGPMKGDREWWAHAEAVVGFLNAYQVSQDPQFARLAAGMWRFIDARVIDHRYGEWFRAVDDAGRPERGAKVSMWKCPYHNGRSCLEVIERLERLEGK